MANVTVAIHGNKTKENKNCSNLINLI